VPPCGCQAFTQIRMSYNQGGGYLPVRTFPTIFSIATLQLIISVYQAKPRRKNLFAQFLSPAKSVGSIRAETKQNRHIVICQFAPPLPLP